jgi:hypothetical protein
MPFYVTVTEQGTNKTRTLESRAIDVETAVERTVMRMYSKAAVFQRDGAASIGRDALQGTQYGQIVRRDPNKPTEHIVLAAKVSVRAETRIGGHFSGWGTPPATAKATP